MLQRTVKHVVAMFIPQPDHNDIEWFRKGETLQAKMLCLSRQIEMNQVLQDQRLPLRELEKSLHGLKQSSKSMISSKESHLTAVKRIFRGKTGGFDQITNKDAIILYSLANGINIDYASIFWEDIILNLKKKQREKVVPYTRFISMVIMHKMKEGYRNDEVTKYPTQDFSVNNWTLKPNQPEEPPFINRMLANCNPEAQPGHKKQSSLKQAFVSSKEATKDPGMHKEDQQATGSLTSLGVTSEARPTLNSVVSASGNDALAVSTTKADPRNYAPSDFIPQQQDQTKSVSERLDAVLTQPLTRKGQLTMLTIEKKKPSTIKRYPVIIIEESDKEENDEIHATKNVETEDTSVPVFISKLTPTDKTFLPKLNDTQLEKYKSLKINFNLEIKLPGELKEIATKLEKFRKIVTSLTSQVAELKTLQWKLPQEFISLPAQVLVFASSKDGVKRIPLAGQANTLPAKGEKNTNQATISELF
ncbi:hypothetical protein Tco_0719622 [Tanacetum coccineum]